MCNNSHTWKLDEDIVVYYYHFYKLNGLNHQSLKQIVDKLGIDIQSFNAREQNLMYVLTNGSHGLSNPATQTVEVANLFEYAREHDENFQVNLSKIVNRIV